MLMHKDTYEVCVLREIRILNFRSLGKFGLDFSFARKFRPRRANGSLLKNEQAAAGDAPSRWFTLALAIQ